MYLTTQQAAAYLGILPSALRMHIRRGTLTPSGCLGGSGPRQSGVSH